MYLDGPVTESLNHKDKFKFNLRQLCSISNSLHWEYVLKIISKDFTSLQWRHNEQVGVSNRQRLDCLSNRLFRPRSKKTSKFRVTGLYEGNSPVSGKFPPQRASNAENVSIWWRHHVISRNSRYIAKRVLLFQHTTECHRIAQFHKSQNAPVPYLTMLHSEQNAHISVLHGALYYMELVHSGICELGQSKQWHQLNITPLLTHWSYGFLALTHRCDPKDITGTLSDPKIWKMVKLMEGAFVKTTIG